MTQTLEDVQDFIDNARYVELVVRPVTETYWLITDDRESAHLFAHVDEFYELLGKGTYLLMLDEMKRKGTGTLRLWVGT